MSMRYRFASLPILAACLPVAAVSAKAPVAPAKAKPAKAAIAPKKLAAASPKAAIKPKAHVAAHHWTSRYARVASPRPWGPNPITVQLNRDALKKAQAIVIVDSGAQLAAYQDAKRKNAAAYGVQLAAWQASVFANTPPGYHVEPAGAPPGYHLEPAVPKGYHLEPVGP